MSLFDRTIDGWQSWADVFCDAPAFAALTGAIFEKERLGMPAPLENLTPGTNAVFRTGDLVVKIFAPEASGFDPAHDFAVETAMLRYAMESGVATSNPVAMGEIADRYRFRYIVTEFVRGVEAYGALPAMPQDAQKAFLAQVKAMLRKLHRPMPGLLPPVGIKRRAIENPRLSNLPTALADGLRAHAEALRWDEETVVHGDLTGDNVIIAPDGSPVIIDFADACHAPGCYELAALAFGLLRGQGALVRAYADGADPDRWVAALLDGLSLHDFGANILTDFAREGKMDLRALRWGDLHEILKRNWWGSKA